jgi:hypothetical protein
VTKLAILGLLFIKGIAPGACEIQGIDQKKHLIVLNFVDNRFDFALRLFVSLIVDRSLACIGICKI